MDQVVVATAWKPLNPQESRRIELIVAARSQDRQTRERAYADLYADLYSLGMSLGRRHRRLSHEDVLSVYHDGLLTLVGSHDLQRPVGAFFLWWMRKRLCSAVQTKGTRKNTLATNMDARDLGVCHDHHLTRFEQIEDTAHLVGKIWHHLSPVERGAILLKALYSPSLLVAAQILHEVLPPPVRVSHRLVDNALQRVALKLPRIVRSLGYAPPTGRRSHDSTTWQGRRNTELSAIRAKLDITHFAKLLLSETITADDLSHLIRHTETPPAD